MLLHLYRDPKLNMKGCVSPPEVGQDVAEIWELCSRWERGALHMVIKEKKLNFSFPLQTSRPRSTKLSENAASEVRSQKGIPAPWLGSPSEYGSAVSPESNDRRQLLQNEAENPLGYARFWEWE